MKQRNIIISLIIVLITISTSSSYGNESQELQWKVNVGDSQRYVVDKYIDHSDSDEDGNIHTQKNEITDINGNTVYVTIQEGTEIEVKIIALSNVATIQITYDDEITEQAREDANPPNGFIAKTVDDLSYWTAWASNRSGYHVEGDLLVMSSSGSGVMLEMTIKRHWKTGWITYVYMRSFEGSSTVMEIEFSMMDTTEPQLEWLVEIGDSREYTVTKYYDPMDSDENGDPSSSTMDVRDENGNMVSVTLKEGSTIKVEVVGLNGGATIKYIYNNEVVGEEQMDGTPPYNFVARTTDDQSYWETWVADKSDYSIEDNLIILSRSTAETQMMFKRSWKTGWLVYVNIKTVFGNNTVEMEYQSETSNGNGNGDISITPYPLIPLIIGITIVVVYTKKQKRS